MSSPCQASSWPNDDDGITINDNDEDDLQSFFQTYDELTVRAQTVELDQTTRNEAKALSVECAASLAACDKVVRMNVAMIKEQTDRIALVSKHWFYGNSVYQPQLWLRGGCAGKIARAKEKLARAEREQPIALQKQRIAQQEHAAASERLRQCQVLYDQSSSAAEQRTRMQDELVQQHSSARLRGLHRESTEHQQTIDSFTDRSKEVEKIGREIDASNQRLQSALTLAKNAETALQQVERLERENQDIALRERSSLSSSSSAATRGHAVAVVQPNHRGTGGGNPRRPGSVYSQDRGPEPTVPVHRSHGQSHQLSSSTSTSTTIIDDRHDDRDNERRNNNFIQIERQQRVASDALRKAHDSIKEGSNALEGAADQLIHYLRRHGSTITTLSSTVRPPARLIVLGGSTNAATAAAAATRNAIEDVRLQVAQLQSLREEYAALVLEMKNDLVLIRTTAQEALQRTQDLVVAEKMRIVAALRERVMMRMMMRNGRSGSTTASCFASVPVAPSAPPSENDVGSYYDEAAAATPPPVVVDAETPVLVPTEHLSTNAMKDIPFATVVPMAPPDVWDDNHNHDCASSGQSEESSRRQFVAKADLV